MYICLYLAYTNNNHMAKCTIVFMAEGFEIQSLCNNCLIFLTYQSDLSLLRLYKDIGIWYNLKETLYWNCVCTCWLIDIKKPHNGYSFYPTVSMVLLLNPMLSHQHWLCWLIDIKEIIIHMPIQLRPLTNHWLN